MRQDKLGNRLYVHTDGMYLKLITEHMPRKIFTFESGRVIKYVKKSNIMQKPYRAIGFNYHALLEIENNEIFKDRNIYIRLGKKYYKVPVLTILNKKEFFHYKDQGFELQCFYPFSIIMTLEINDRKEYVNNLQDNKKQSCLFQ